MKKKIHLLEAQKNSKKIIVQGGIMTLTPLQATQIRVAAIIRIQVRMKIPRTVARTEEQKIKGSLTELMILQQSINDRAA